MAVRTPQFKTFDYGNAVQTGQNIKHNRMRNQALGQDMQEREDLIKKRNEAAEIRRQLDGMPAAIEEMDKRGLYDQADKLRDNYLKQMKSGVDIANTLAQGLDESNYEQVRQDMIQSGAITGEMWPVKYSDDWWAKKVATSKSDLQTHTRRWAEEGVTFSQDFVDRDGSVIWEGDKYEASTDRNARTKENEGPGGGFEYKASDDNAMGNQATRLFGGTYDPATGQFSGLDPEKAAKVQAVHAAATELYATAQGQITHAQAVREAARRLRIAVEDPNDRNSLDPAGIRVPGLPDGTPAPTQ